MCFFKKSNYAHILGLFILCSQFLAWCLSTISYRNNFVGYLSGGVTFLSVVSYVLLSKCKLDIAETRQLVNINRFVLVISAVLLLTCARQHTFYEKVASLVFSILWLSASLIVGKRINEKDKAFFNVRAYLKEYKLIIILCVLLGLLSYESGGLQFKWDGLLYFESSQKLNMYSISSLAQYGHISQFYSLIIKILTLIIGNVAHAMAIGNVIMLIISIVYFYKLLKVIFPQNTELMYSLATAVYGFSPFLLGMVNYFSLDYYLICLMPVVVYYGLCKQWIYYVVVSIFFVFTKETAIIIYAVICVEILVHELVVSNDGIFERVKYISCRMYYYYMLLVGILWLTVYKLLGPWSAGDGGFVIDKAYIIEKLKVLNILNFNWILLLIAIIGSVTLAIKGTDNDYQKQTFALCWSMYLFFGIFSVFFRTVNHARYIDSNVFVLYLLAICSILSLKKKWVINCMLICVLTLVLASCFLTIDPLTKKVFKNVDIGNTVMISTSDVIIGDSMIYNRQMLYMEEAISEILDYAYMNNCNIAMPALYDSTYFFDGMQVVSDVVGGYRKRNFYYENGHRYVLEQDSGNGLEIYSVSENVNIDDVVADSKKPVVYIYMNGVGDELKDEIEQKCKLLDEYTTIKKGWKIKAIMFE